MVNKPLAGLTIVEIGHSVAAPFAGLILADLGAEVIKVENPGSGDYARGWGPPFWNDTSTTFYALNRGKRAISVDFSVPEQAEGLRQLILTRADAVIQNVRPGVLDRFGLGQAQLHTQKQRLIWCDIAGFGSPGPLSGKLGYDPLAQAASGIMSVTGHGGAKPTRVGVSLVDMGSGMWVVIGLLVALLNRTKSGKGAHVSTSLFETALTWMMGPLAAYAADGNVRQPQGSGLAEIVPYQAFEASDGWIMIAAGNDNLFRKLCGVLSLPHLVDDLKYATNAARVVDRTTLISILAERISSFTKAQLLERLDDAGVPNSPILTIDEVFAHPHTAALGALSACSGDSLPVVGLPLRFDGQIMRAGTPPPRLGEHNNELMFAQEHIDVSQV